MPINSIVITAATLLATIKGLARIPTSDTGNDSRIFDLIVSSAVKIYKPELDQHTRELVVTLTSPIIDMTLQGHVSLVEVLVLHPVEGYLTVKEAGQPRGIFPPSTYAFFNFSRTEVINVTPTYKVTLSGPVTGNPSFTAKVRYKLLQIPDSSSSNEILNYDTFLDQLIQSVLDGIKEVREQ